MLPVKSLVELQSVVRVNDARARGAAAMRFKYDCWFGSGWWKKSCTTVERFWTQQNTGGS
jgi:hypothetical protein